MKFSTPIEHVVVLMMENHSFDNMLGWLPGVGELTGKENNEYNGTPYPVSPNPSFSTNPGPAHELINVNLQVLGTQYPSTGTSPLDPQPLVTMAGFVTDYMENAGAVAGQEENVMGCYCPEQVPVISRLAQTFRVCRHWYCSVPGPTGPNRIYANCASSGGYAGGAYSAVLGGSPNKSGMMPRQMASLSSIFGAIADGGGSWGVYFEDTTFAPELVLNDVAAHREWVHHDPGFTTFAADLQGTTLPNYSFLTPALWQNSQHPPDDVRIGEVLIANIYQMIVNSHYWGSTLFILTYDEHGGFYDSSPPPKAVNPDGKVWGPPDYPDANPQFAFNRLGVRVPAILISPYLDAAVDDTQYEHSSIPKTVLNLFELTWPNPTGQEPANARLAEANAFDGVIGCIMRTDVPLSIPCLPPPLQALQAPPGSSA